MLLRLAALILICAGSIKNAQGEGLGLNLEAMDSLDAQINTLLDEADLGHGHDAVVKEEVAGGDGGGDVDFAVTPVVAGAQRWFLEEPFSLK